MVKVQKSQNLPSACSGTFNLKVEPPEVSSLRTRDGTYIGYKFTFIVGTSLLSSFFKSMMQ